MRAYDILTDADQRATYDHLLAIALQPAAATPSTRTYETVRKVASNTMAATVISAVLVGGYTVFGLFSKPPGAAEIAADRTAGERCRSPRLHPAVHRRRKSSRARREATSRPARRRAHRCCSARREGSRRRASRPPRTLCPPSLTYNLGIQYYPRFATAYFDRGVVLYRNGALDRPLTDVAAAKRMTDSKRTKTRDAAARAAQHRPLMIVPVHARAGANANRSPRP